MDKRNYKLIAYVDINRNFNKYNVIENMLWCIENLEVTAIEDYEWEVFGHHGDTVDFSMSIELLVKIIKPDAVSTIYTDKLIDLETGQYMTDFDKERVFAEEFK